MLGKKGLDLSQHNGNIDFNKVKSSGIDFVILRIGWIGNKNNHTLDTKFLEYYKQAKQVGLSIGLYVYNYCTSVDKTVEGAKWVVDKILSNNINIEMPIFLDMEDSTIKGCGKNILTQMCVEFCKYIESKGFVSGIYANLDWFKNYLNVNNLLNYKIWLAEWTTRSSHSANFRVDLWQFSNSGNVSGINGRVDVNILINSLENKNEESNNQVENKEGDFEMKLYKNGSTVEPVYQDSACSKKIGSLNRYESCECYGIIDGKALVVYNVDGTNYKKTGFVKWLGGVK